MESLLKAYQSVKRIAWNTATVSLYIVHRRLNPHSREASYSVLGVNADDKIRRKLRNIASSTITGSNKVMVYDFNTADQDNDFLGIKTSETDMQKIIEAITSTEQPPFATKYKDLFDAWVYVARLDIDKHPPLFSVRSISKGWKTTKVSQLINSIFTNNMLIDIDQADVFKIDNKVDFFSCNGVIFIADKKNFEASMNFRVGMEKNRDKIIQEFIENKIIEKDNTLFSGLIGDKMHRLRKLAQVKNAGYYTDPNFMNKLMVINKQEAWGLTYSASGTLVITEENIDTVLKILNNDRLRSQINNEDFDVDVKHKL